ncbi:MAG: hypothetical protein WCL50_17245 [Spirochaetota bacterium]
MKRITLVLVGGIALASLAFAQPYNRSANGPMMGGRYHNAQPGSVQAEPTAKNIEGKLVFVDKIPAIQTKDKTYLIRMPQFFENAYFDSIKEGAQVKADGFEFAALPGQDKPWFAVTKATIGAKTYDYSTQGFGPGRGGAGGRGSRGGMMGGNYGGGRPGGMMGGCW